MSSSMSVLNHSNNDQQHYQSSPNVFLPSSSFASSSTVSSTSRRRRRDSQKNAHYASSVRSGRSAAAIMNFHHPHNEDETKIISTTTPVVDRSTTVAVTAEAVVDATTTTTAHSPATRHNSVKRYGSTDESRPTTANLTESVATLKTAEKSDAQAEADDEENVVPFSFKKLTARQRLTLILICAVSRIFGFFTLQLVHKKFRFPPGKKPNAILYPQTAFFWSIVFACIGPFFPSEALAKGATATEVGGIFGIFELVVMISSPLWGRVVPILGPRFMYLAGIFTTGFTNILYGSLQWAPTGRTFVILCFLLRSFEGLGAACYMTASLPILAHQFPDHISSVIGIESTCVSIGFMLGPLIGSIFYTIDGFYLPFVVLGTTGIIMCVIGIFLLPPITYAGEEEEHVGLLKVVSIPIVPLVLLCNISASAGLAFFDAMLSPHLKFKFGLSEILIGVWFLIMGVCEACTAPFVGYLLDAKPWHLQAMLVGTLLAFAGYVFVGPTPLLPFLPSVIPISIAAQLFVGLAIGFLFVPPAGLIFKACQQAGLPDGPGVHGAIGGLITLSASFGGFFGPTVGGYIVGATSFEWASTAAAGLFLFEAGLLLATIFKRTVFSKRTNSIKPI